MSLDRSEAHTDRSSIDRVVKRNSEEIWIDGPLSSTNPKAEIWIDGPYKYSALTPKLHFKNSTVKHRSNSQRTYTTTCKTPILSQTNSTPPFLSSTILSQENNDTLSTNFDNESVVSSHCHVPVLPVFKDHTLLPFRSNQIVQMTKSNKVETSKLDFQLSTNKLNDDLEMLEKTLETLLIPSPIVPIKNDKQSIISKSLNRIDQLSSLMSNDEKNKRLSRIVSPTRFDKMFK